MTSRSLTNSRRAALEAKLRKAQLGIARSPKTARSVSNNNNNNNNNDSENNNSSGVPPLGNGRAPTDVDFDTALFACWKKLRALFVAADKSRSGRLPQKKVVAILQRNHVGSSRDEAILKTKPHLEGGGVNYNAFIKQVLQSRSR